MFLGHWVYATDIYSSKMTINVRGKSRMPAKNPRVPHRQWWFSRT